MAGKGCRVLSDRKKSLIFVDNHSKIILTNSKQKGEISLKKIMMVLMAMMIMLTSGTVFAKSATWVQEGYDFTAPQAALIDSLRYAPNKSDEMTPDEIYQTIVGEMKESLFIKTRTVDQYKAVLADKNINLDVLDKKEAKKVYADNLNGYVDIRIIPTVISRPGRTVLCVDVLDVATNKLVYSKQFSTKFVDTVDVYKEVTGDFDKEFNKIMKRDKFKK